MTSDAQRTELGRLMDLLVRSEKRVHYAQRRPMQTGKIRNLRLALLRPGGITMDCSESVTLLCRLAGLRDPNGLHYSGSGFTGTLLHYLPHYFEPRKARTGALVVFGDAPGDHVCMVRFPGDDPMLFSHGSEAGPKLLRLSEMQPSFRGATTFLSVARLG